MKLWKIGMVLLIAMALTACNRGKDSMATAPQTATQAASTAPAAPETDFEFMYGMINAYTGTETSVVIPSQIQNQPVTIIMINAFWEKGITSVTIPNSVTDIAIAAFGRNNLTSVVIPDSVVVISDGAFFENPLTSITIGTNVELGGWFGDVYTSAFDDAFDTAYNNGGKQAGTYTLNNGVWTKQ